MSSEKEKGLSSSKKSTLARLELQLEHLKKRGSNFKANTVACWLLIKPLPSIAMAKLRHSITGEYYLNPETGQPWFELPDALSTQRKLNNMEG